MTDKSLEEAIDIIEAHEDTRRVAEQLERELIQSGAISNVVEINMEVVNDPAQVQGLLIQLAQNEQEMVHSITTLLSIVQSKLTHLSQQAMITSDVKRVVEGIQEINSIVTQAKNTVPPAMELKFEVSDNG